MAESYRVWRAGARAIDWGWLQLITIAMVVAGCLVVALVSRQNLVTWYGSIF
jgi:hypothetical protein